MKKNNGNGEAVKLGQWEFRLIPSEKLYVSNLQRKPSKPHIKNLAESISNVGFISVLTVVEGDNGKYIIVDGQHRYLAGLEVGMKEFPCLVIPKEMEYKLQNFNIEKAPSISEKVYVAGRIYETLLEKEPNKNEADLEDYIDESSYITLHYFVENSENSRGLSSWNSLIALSDYFFEEPLKEASKERKRRGKILAEEVAPIILEIADMIKERTEGQWTIAQAISLVKPKYKGIKFIEFDELVEEVKKRAEYVKDNIDEIIGLSSGGGEDTEW